MGLLPDTQNCGLRMRRECRERFPRHRGLAIQTCITARAWRTCRDAWRGSLTSGFLWSGWRGICSRHSRRMRIPQFYVSGKRPMGRVAFSQNDYSCVLCKTRGKGELATVVCIYQLVPGCRRSEKRLLPKWKCWQISRSLIIFSFSDNQIVVGVAFFCGEGTCSVGLTQQKCRHDDEIFVSACTRSCHVDNFLCNLWRKFRQYDSVPSQWVQSNQFYSESYCIRN